MLNKCEVILKDGPYTDKNKKKTITSKTLLNYLALNQDTFLAF